MSRLPGHRAQPGAREHTNKIALRRSGGDQRHNIVLLNGSRSEAAGNTIWPWGQRRADSVKRALTLLGVPASQIETVSFGSEKPKAISHEEQAHAENRRSDLLYTGSKSAAQ